MTDNNKQDEIDIAAGKSTRRSLLRLGAVAVPAVVTLRPAWAKKSDHGGAMASLAMCQIPIPHNVNKKGEPCAPDEGFAPPRGGYYLAEELKEDGPYSPISRVDSKDQLKAHLKYIESLRPGDAGFSCYASIQYRSRQG